MGDISAADPSEPVELIGGVEKRDIKVVPPDPTWPAKFATEREKILTALGVRAVRVDHVGSTSVPGLAAKPIIDIGLSVLDVDREEHYLPDLIGAGYRLRVREPGHRMVRTPDLGVHVHVCTAGSDCERRPLLFRDWLRYDQSDRAAYNSLKNQLAQEDWPDMNAYAEAKGPLITESPSARRSGRDAQDGSFDQVLAGALRYLTGDQLLLRGETWAVHQYAFYLAFMTVSGRPPGEGWTPPIGMLLDQLECALHHAHRPVRMPEQFRIDDPPVRRSPNGSGA